MALSFDVRHGRRRPGSVTLDETLFGIQPNVPVLHQVVTAQLAAARAGTQSTKTRAEVSGGGRKPFKQKGTGRARQGSERAPQFTGGGVALGPKPRSYRQRTPRKMIQLALRSALSDRAAEAGSSSSTPGRGRCRAPRTPGPPSTPWASTARCSWCLPGPTRRPTSLSATCPSVQLLLGRASSTPTTSSATTGSSSPGDPAGRDRDARRRAGRRGPAGRDAPWSASRRRRRRDDGRRRGREPKTTPARSTKPTRAAAGDREPPRAARRCGTGSRTGDAGAERWTSQEKEADDE